MTADPHAPLLSVCIVCWNTRDLLLDCLASLAADPDRSRWEVIVVDNGSRDRTAEVAASAGATVVPEPCRGYDQRTSHKDDRYEIYPAGKCRALGMSP